MKYAIVILDGAAGWPLDDLGGKTTLAAAHTPNLDRLAARRDRRAGAHRACRRRAVLVRRVHVDPGLRPGRRPRRARRDRGREHGDPARRRTKSANFV